LTARTTSRGQPLVLLGVLLAGWFGMRVAFWQSPWESGEGVALASSGLSEPQRVTTPEPDRTRNAGEAGDERFLSSDARPASGQGVTRDWLPRPLPVIPARPAWERLPLLAPLPPAQPPASGATRHQAGAQPAATLRRASVGPAIGHNLLMVAGLGGELPDALVAALQADPRPPAALARRAAGPVPVEAAPAPAGIVPNRVAPARSRWSADAWVLLRGDKDGPLLPGHGAYGRSQAGAVLRYRLAPSSGHAPQAHLRGSVALGGVSGTDLRDSEVAVGFSARPIPSVPVRVAAEARVSDTSGGARVRPAVYAVTEFNPVPLPLGARGELYLQGGYVGGDFATAFVDGQARVERPVGRAGPAEFFAGAAAWSGAQEGAGRVDVGPSVGASVSLGRFHGRVTGDYRFRVAGESRPASGPALTLYAGF
jgi:hypothetical protein